MTKQDQYLQSLLPSILQPGEQVLHAAYMRRQPGLLMQLLLVGGLLLFLMTKAYFAVLTNRRLILIRTKMSFWTGAPALMNLGVEEYDVRALQKVTVSGFANNRSMTFHTADGKKNTLRISPWFKQIAGTKAFFEQVPQLASSGQLAQLAGGGHAPQMQQGGYVAPPQQHYQGYGPPPQQQQQQQPGYGPPPQQQQYQHQGYGAPPQAAGFAPGAPVQVATPDGYRYPATVVQAQDGHYLCAMPNGQQHWFPAAAVGPA
jgi:hypothetical protein